MSAITQAFPPPKFGFAGHETFPFRYGWLKKAISGSRLYPGLFNQDQAIVTLGVGKNMVQSIHHWGLATGMLNEVARGEVQPSMWGKKLLEEWDPHLEDLASLWLIHYFLITHPEKAACWHLAFFRWSRPEFNRAELTDFLTELAERQSLKARRATLERDVDCFIRTYLPARGKAKEVMEESFDCPLVELGLLRRLKDEERYQFVVGPKPTLPSEIVGFALLRFLDTARQNRQTVAFQDCLYAPSSPGQAFKLDENTLMEHMEEIQLLCGGAVELDDTAGLKQVYIRGELDPGALLNRYYEERIRG